MSPLYLKDGKLLLVGNALAGSPDCCCGSCCKSDGYTDTCEDGLSESTCLEQGGTYHAGKTCAENPCGGACCKSDGYTDTCEDGLSESECQGQGGTYHAGKSCTENPCQACEQFSLFGNQAYVDGYCGYASTQPYFHSGSLTCPSGLYNCTTRTLITDYGGGMADWMVTLCCVS